MRTLVYHTVTHRQGSHSKLWECWCTACSWHSDVSRHEDEVTQAGAEHMREMNGVEPPPRAAQVMA